MKRLIPHPAALLAAAAACGASLSAQAQSVTIYGILDQAVEHLSNVNAAGNSLTRLPNLTGSLPSRFGFRGSEDLGDGLKAVFGLESGIALDTGSLNNGGRLFGRFAYVGLSGGWGTLTGGRLANMTFLNSTGEIFGGNLYSNASLDSYLPNARSDNTIGYLGTFNGFTVGVTHSLGRDVIATGGPAATGCPGELAGSSACKQTTALVRYDGGTYGATLSYDTMNGGPGAQLGLSDASYRDKRTYLSGYVKFGDAKIAGGLIRRDRTTATELKSDLWYLGASYLVNANITLDAQFSRLDVKDSPADASLAVVRGSYAFSKRTMVYAMWGHISNGTGSAVSVSAGGTVGTGMTQNGIAAGLRHVF